MLFKCSRSAALATIKRAEAVASRSSSVANVATLVASWLAFPMERVSAESVLLFKLGMGGWDSVTAEEESHALLAPAIGVTTPAADRAASYRANAAACVDADAAAAVEAALDCLMIAAAVAP